MKDWCKHKFGFVNFDDSTLYFSSTGNWSDTLELGEFNEGRTKRSSSAERFKSISYLAVLAIAVILFLWAMGFHSLNFSAVIGIAWFSYSAYHYMSTGLSGEFKIPYANITRLEIDSSVSKITFLDYYGNEAIQEIKLDKKGLNLFFELQILLEKKQPIKSI